MPALIAFAKSYWYLFVIAFLMLAVHKYREDAKDAVNELAVVVANNKAAIAEFKQKNAEGALADLKFHQEQEAKYGSQKAALATSLDATAHELSVVKARLAAAGKPQPIRIASNICDGPGAGGRLSGAIQKAFGDVDSITGRTAAGIIQNQIDLGASLVGPAGIKQLEASQLREFALRGNKVNAVKSP